MKNQLSKIKSSLRGLIPRFKSLPRGKKIVVIIFLVIAVFVIWKVITDATKEPPYKLAKATISNVEEIVSETGNVTTSNRTDVFSPSNGIVTEMLVGNGDMVEEGEVVFEVESTATVQEQQAAHASYLAAASALGIAKSSADSLKSDMLSKWQTFKDLATDDAYETSDGAPKNDNRNLSPFQIAQSNWLASESKYKNQQTEIAAARADSEAKRILYESTKDAIVKAPVTGKVANVSATEGNGVLIKTAVSSHAPVLTVVSFAPTEAVISLGESEITKVEEGQAVEVDISAVDDKKYKGIVRRVDEIGTEKTGVMRYAVYIEITNADNKIRPGMSVDVDITTKKVKDVLTVLNSSVKPHNGGRAVRIVNQRTKEVEFIPVKVGIRGQSKTQILSGIEEGQEVVVSLSNESIKRPSLF